MHGDAKLVDELREGRESAFEALVAHYHASMVRLARSFVASDAIAEEVAQEAWIGVLKGIATFEGRSSLKRWIFTIVINRAKSRGLREVRFVPFSSLAAREVSQAEAAVDPDRFLGPEAPWPGHWAAPPRSWREDPEAMILAGETRAQLARALKELPPAQRAVVTLRDVAGFDAAEICNELDIRETHMRVLLHRGRSKLRAALEQYLNGEPARFAD